MTEPLVRAPTESEPIIVGERSVSLDQLTHWEEITRRAPSFHGGPPEKVHQTVAMMFIDHLWMRGEAQRLGIEVTEAEVDALVNARIESDYSEDGALEAFLQETGQTLDDLRLRVRMARYSEVMRDHVTRDATSDEDRRERMDRFREAYRAYWSARTRCRDPYFLADRCVAGDGTEAPASETSERPSLLRRFLGRG